jgi:hypothetical protein
MVRGSAGILHHYAEMTVDAAIDWITHRTLNAHTMLLNLRPPWSGTLAKPCTRRRRRPSLPRTNRTRPG